MQAKPAAKNLLAKAAAGAAAASKTAGATQATAPKRKPASVHDLMMSLRPCQSACVATLQGAQQASSPIGQLCCPAVPAANMGISYHAGSLRRDTL